MLRAVAIKRAGQKHPGEIIDTLLLDYEARRAPSGILLGPQRHADRHRAQESAPIATDDCLILEDGRLIEIVARPEPLLEVRAPDVASLARLAWHLGDRHIPAQLFERRLRVRREEATQKLLHALKANVLAIEAPFEPESGAYSGGHHAHDHNGHHGHDH